MMTELIDLFYSYSHEDETLLKKLNNHLAALQRQGLIRAWYDRDILAGGLWVQEINSHLQTARIILLLISPEFIASDYCYSNEMTEALKRHALGEARVIPIILRPCDFTVRHGEKTDATIILTALGVDLEGSREVLALRACAEESKDGWSCLLQDLRTRGVVQMDLVVTDGHDGLLAALASLFPATLRQRCVVHKQRNVMNAIPHREQKDVAAELAGIWKAPTLTSRLTIVWAVMQDIRLPKIPVS